MRNINDEFHFGEKQDEFIRNEEYTFLEERGEYDERFFHWDEYNREFIGGLREKEEGEEAAKNQQLHCKNARLCAIRGCKKGR